MSYSNTIANTKTQSHSIVPETKETTAVERIQSAQGTGKTGSAIRKVAQFIGMDAPEGPAKTLVFRGNLSVDLELEMQQWRSSRAYTASLEEEEKSRRMADTEVENARRNKAFVTSKATLQRLQSPKWTNRDLPASKKFLNYIRKNAALIEQTEAQRRIDDALGETTKRSLARQTSSLVFSGLRNPVLRSTGHLTNQHLVGYTEVFGHAGEIAMKKLLPVAESFAASAYQIGNFAARAAYFFGGKAAVKAQDVGQQAAVQGQVLGSQALAKGQVLGQKAAVDAQILGSQAIAGAQVLGQKALAGAQVLGHKAVVDAQILGNQAITGAQTLGEQAQRTALNTAAGAQSVAAQTIEKSKDLTHQAQAAANNAIAGAQQMAGQAVEKVKELKNNLLESSEPTLSWKQLAIIEEEERALRLGAQFGSNRFARALHTSTLVKDLIIAQNPHYSADSEPSKHYGTSILEETERLRRIVSDKTSPVARINAKRAAAIITLYRQQTLGRIQSGTALAAAVPVLVKELQAPQQVAPIRYQAAM